METRFQTLETFRNKKLTLAELTQLRDVTTLATIDTSHSKTNLPQLRKQIGATTLLTAAQKELVAAKARMAAAEATKNTSAIAQAAHDIERAQSLLNEFYLVASSQLDYTYGEVQNCPFENKTDKDTGYTQFWFAVQCFQTEETYLLLLHRFLLYKKVSTETLCKEKLDTVTIELLSQEFPHPFDNTDESTFFSALRIQNTIALKVMLDLFPALAFKTNNYFFPPAHFAAMEGCTESLKSLQASDATTITQALNTSKETTLMMALINDRIETMASLLTNAPELLDKPNQYGETALFVATSTGKTEAVKLLLHHKANITVLSNQSSRNPNKTALDVAVGMKDQNPIQKEIYDLFMTPFQDGYTLFHRSIVEEQPFITQLFCECGVDFTVKTTSNDAFGNMTALQLAYAQRKNEALFTILNFCHKTAESAAADYEKAQANTQKWNEKPKDEQELVLIKIKYEKLDELLALDRYPVIDIGQSIIFDQPEKDSSGKLAEPLTWLFDILMYAKNRNNGRKHVNKPSDEGVAKKISSTLKYADRAVGQLFGMKPSELPVVVSIRDIFSYSELQKLTACWQAFGNILEKHEDPLDTFDDESVKIFSDERLGVAAKAMVKHHEATKQRAEAEHPSLPPVSGKRALH